METALGEWSSNGSWVGCCLKTNKQANFIFLLSTTSSMPLILYNGIHIYTFITLKTSNSYNWWIINSDIRPKGRQSGDWKTNSFWYIYRCLCKHIIMGKHVHLTQPLFPTPNGIFMDYTAWNIYNTVTDLINNLLKVSTPQHCNQHMNNVCSLCMTKHTTRKTIVPWERPVSSLWGHGRSILQ